WSTISVPVNDCPPGFSGDCPLLASGSLTYDGAHGFWTGWSAHFTGTGWVNTDFFGPSFYSVASGFSAGINALSAIPGSSSVRGVGAIGSGNSSSADNTLVAVNGPVP